MILDILSLIPVFLVILIIVNTIIGDEKDSIQITTILFIIFILTLIFKR